MDKRQFGKYIKRRREELGLTQKELANALYVAEGAVSKWENGRSYPDIELIPNLALTLGVTIDTLFAEAENESTGINFMTVPLIAVALLVGVGLMIFGINTRNKSIVNVTETATTQEQYSHKRAYASRLLDDGWAFYFVKDDDGLDVKRYGFYAVNLRYRYSDDYVHIYKTEPDRMHSYEYVPGILLWGDGNTAQQKDMEYINNVILDNSKTDEELLALNPDDFEFETIDKNLFFELMREALSNGYIKDGPNPQYWELQNMLIVAEYEFKDGYQFQVGALNENNNIGEIYIDVLYKTGEDYKDYEQLSDLIKDGKATDDQKELFELIKEIVNQIKKENSFIANGDSYKDKKIAGVDMSRLYAFLNDIHNGLFDYYKSGLYFTAP